MNGSTAQISGGQPTPPKARLLLAEDEPPLWQFLYEVLQADYEVEIATDGEQAWRAAQRDTPDLILSDVGMPGLDGIALTRRLRSLSTTATVPIILLSADGRPDLIPQGLEAGANDVQLKPFHVSELLMVLHGRLLERVC